MKVLLVTSLDSLSDFLLSRVQCESVVVTSLDSLPNFLLS